MHTNKIQRSRVARLPACAAAAAMLVTLAFSARADYHSEVLRDGPLAYYRLNDTTLPDVATNGGSLGASGNGLYIGATHRVPGALVASPNAAAAYDGTGVRTIVPYNPALNPPASHPFTVEGWVLPTIDGLGNAQAPLWNRHSQGNRQGWAFFQRSSGTGFNFRMYNQNGSSQSVDITGGPYTVGQWTHLAAVWNGTTATLYVNGAPAGSQTAGYVANTDNPFSIGAYGGDNPGDNPFTGSIDEVAFYTNALSAVQIANHYSNGTNAAPATPYSSVVLGDGAIEYLRLDEASPAVDTAVNSGSLGAATDGLHFPGARHRAAGAIIGDPDTAMTYSAIDTNSDDGGVPTVIPYNAALNPNGSFTIEAWLRPTEEGAGNAQCPLFNCEASTENYGWDFYQRASAAGSGQKGWEFYMNNASGGRVGDAVGGTYTVGQWCHLVAVYNAVAATATLYVNGAQVAQSTGVSGYVPNPSFPMSIGGYSDASQNPFVGDIDEFAFYTNALSSTRILAHYQNGINSSRGVSYSSLVLSDGPAEYLRLDEPAKNIVANSGSAGAVLNATYVNTTNILAGPQPPAFAGFEPTNLGTYFNGLNSYIELENPAVLNFSGAITLEAWIRPDALPGSFGDIIAHGVNDTGNAEMMMRLDGNDSYEVGSWDGISGHGTSASAPAGDVGNGNWVHLVGTYDGSNWNLYRNGVLAASAADGTGSLPVNNANWAIGARGRWKNGPGFPTSGQDRQFTGGIDEVAIYNYALSSNRVAVHYSAGLAGTSPLAIVSSGTTGTLTWSMGTLQEAINVTGPYTDVLGAVSPYTPPAGPTKKFYRLKF